FVRGDPAVAVTVGDVLERDCRRLRLFERDRAVAVRVEPSLRPLIENPVAFEELGSMRIVRGGGGARLDARTLGRPTRNDQQERTDHDGSNAWSPRVLPFMKMLTWPGL